MTRAPLSIAAPIFMLAVMSVTLATALLFAITFSGPPPRPAPLRLESLAKALDGAPIPFSDLRITRSIEPAPAPQPGERRATNAESLLAQMAQIPVGDVHVFARDVQHNPLELRGQFTIARRAASGWVVLRTAPEPWLTRWHQVTLTAMAAALVALAALAWWIAQAIARPIRRLGEAAAQTRLGTPVAIPRGGPREVDELAGTLAAMQERLVQGVEGRTAMLAAIAHDLGTPLSRIAFWLEQLPDAARDRASADIDEMRAMLQSVLRFAREERTGEARVRVEIGSLVDALAEDMAATGAPVAAAGGPRAIVRGEPAALRRMLANIVENAVRYGRGADMHWAVEPGWVTISVDDAGPGFDPATSAALFTPFVRGDPSRNRATGGSGLGLAIVRSIAEAHGGEVRLSNHPAGGRVTVRLPLD